MDASGDVGVLGRGGARVCYRGGMADYTISKIPVGATDFARCAGCPSGKAKRSVCLVKRGRKVECGLCASCRDRMVRLDRERASAEKRQREFVAKFRGR